MLKVELKKTIKSFAYYLGRTFALGITATWIMATLITGKVELIPLLALIATFIYALFKQSKENKFFFYFIWYFTHFFVALYWLSLLYYRKFPILEKPTAIAILLVVLYALLMTLYDREGGVQGYEELRQKGF